MEIGSIYKFVLGDYVIRDREYITVTDKTSSEIIYTLYQDEENEPRPKILKNQSSEVFICEETLQEYVIIGNVRINARNVYYNHIDSILIFY